MNRAEAYFQLAALLDDGCIGILSVSAVAAVLGIEALATLFVYGAVLLIWPICGLVMIGLIARR